MSIDVCDDVCIPCLQWFFEESPESGFGYCMRSLCDIIDIIVSIVSRIISCIRYIKPDCCNDLAPMTPEIRDPIAEGLSRGPNYYRVAYELDERESNPLLNPVYFNALTVSEHQDWDLIGVEDAGQIQSFFKELLGVHPRTGLTAQNGKRIKNVTIAIVNILIGIRRKKGEEVFKEQCRIVFLRMSESLKNCIYNTNTEFESILLDLVVGSHGGALEERVAAVLQKLRLDCFRQAVHNVIQRVRNTDSRAYYNLHEANTTQYYFRLLYPQLGLPKSASALVQGFEGCNLLFQEDAVLEEFHKLCSLAKTIDTIYHAVGDPQRCLIPIRLFTEWVQQTGREPIMDASGYYDKPLIREYLLEKNVLARA